MHSDNPGNFINDLIASDLSIGKNSNVRTRFPPEPNGYLHIGHAKSICTNFGLAKKFNGECNLRFDDTNPEAEDAEYVKAIESDVQWLGFEYGDRKYFASDYFEQLFQMAVQLIKAGKAYVDVRSADEISKTRGDYHKTGMIAPDRSRPVDESLALFDQMRAGKFADGHCVLRAKIDMASDDVKLRDPIMYRIRHATHHRTENQWCIYPTYDWAHGQSDAIEGITHSICTMEFKNHHRLYDWYQNELSPTNRPEQIEFARLNLTYTVLSKRKLRELVEAKLVSGWDDPRMPTLAGMRRRGYTPKSIVDFCARIGVSTRDSVIDVSLLDHSLREDLNASSIRVMAILRPLKLTIQNMGDNVEWLDAPYDSEKPELSSRKIPLSKHLLIERDDFDENPGKKWLRLAPGKEVRLRYGCIIKCVDVKKDLDGEVVEIICTWDPDSLGGIVSDGRKIGRTLHWVSESHSILAEVRLYERLFSEENPEKDSELGIDWKSHLNPSSLEVVETARLEPSLIDAKSGDRFQFERLGYFCVDSDSKTDAPIYNRTIALRDSFRNASHSATTKTH